METEVIIRIYGDSICNPRYHQDISLQYIYPELLKEKLQSKTNKKVYLYNKSQNNIDIETAKRLFKADEGCFLNSNSLAIIQLGIVDCAPRPIHPKVRNMVSRLPEPVKNAIIKFLHDNRKAMLKIKSYNTTPLKKFKKAYKNIVSYCKNHEGLICIGIGPVSESMKEKSYGLEESIIKYNAAIQDICKEYNCIYIDMNASFRKVMKENSYSEDDVLLADGHHYTKLGHTIALDIVYNELIKIAPLE